MPQVTTSNFQSRPPDYNVGVISKVSSRKGNVGVAWKNEGGRITLRLNPFVVLDNAEDEMVLTLFPVEARVYTAPPARRGSKTPAADVDPAPSPHDGDDIPF